MWTVWVFFTRFVSVQSRPQLLSSWLMTATQQYRTTSETCCRSSSQWVAHPIHFIWCSSYTVSCMILVTYCFKVGFFYFFFKPYVVISSLYRGELARTILIWFAHAVTWILDTWLLNWSATCLFNDVKILEIKPDSIVEMNKCGWWVIL